MSELDLTYLNEISGGDEDFIKEMIETFLEETPKDLDQIKIHFDSKDWAEMGKTAHKMKSSIKMFGFESLKNKALFLEQNGKKGEKIDEFPNVINTFISGVNSALDELKGKL
ncbi:MAG: Hpt domain-containing protein [Bacteroidia bacterium]